MKCHRQVASEDCTGCNLCVEVCPAKAIVFGDLKNPGSAVSRLAEDGRAYQLLAELNTDPGVVYLARRREDHA